MRIAFDISPAAENVKTGIGFYITNIIEELKNNYTNNEYLFNLMCFRNRKKKVENLSSLINSSNCHLQIQTGNISIYRNLSQVFPIPYSFLFKKKADVHHFWNYFLPLGVPRKKIVTVYDMVYMACPETMYKNNKYTLDFTVKRSCRRADSIVTISEFSKNEIIKYLDIDPKKISVIPCGIDTRLFFPINEDDVITSVKRKFNIQGDYFLYLGTLEPRKNLVRLIQAYKIVKQRYPDSPKLVLAGKPGWLYEGIFIEIDKQKLNNEIINLDYVSNENRNPLICGATGFLFPSLYEGFGMPPLEAMACGIPVLTSNVSSLPEVVGDAAIKVDPLNVEEIANGIEHLFLDNETRKILSSKGLKRTQYFSWEKSAHKLMKLYEDIV